MNFNTRQIEEITQSVLRELTARGVSIDSAPSSEQAAGSRLDARVITEDVLAAADTSCGMITIDANAVITPSGRDFIRKHELIVSNVGRSRSQSQTGTVISIGSSVAFESAAISAGWKVETTNCEFGAARKSQAVVQSQPVVCCGGEPSMIACMLNRKTCIRAAVVTSSTELDRLIQIMKPQIACVGSKGWSFVEARQLLKLMQMVGSSSPNDWKEISGGAS